MSSVIIVTINYNQNDYTLKCIKSILESDYDNYKILLIDNGSTKENYNNLVEDLPDDNHLIIRRIYENRGYVGGVNYGLEEGMKLNPDYFLIMNNDTTIDKNALRELIFACVRYNNLAIVSGKVYDYEEKNKLQFVGYSYKEREVLTYKILGLNEIDNGQFQDETERDMLDDIFWVFPKRLIDEIGYYSNYFWFNAEQADFALRAKKVGYKLIYNPQAMIWHKGSISIGGRNFNPSRAYWNTQSQLILRKRHLSKKFFRKYYLKQTTGLIRTYIKSIVLLFIGINRFKYANAKLAGWMYFNKWSRNPLPNLGKNPFISK